VIFREAARVDVNRGPEIQPNALQFSAIAGLQPGFLQRQLSAGTGARFKNKEWSPPAGTRDAPAEAWHQASAGMLLFTPRPGWSSSQTRVRPCGGGGGCQAVRTKAREGRKGLRAGNSGVPRREQEAAPTAIPGVDGVSDTDQVDGIPIPSTLDFIRPVRSASYG
jgi:hypothetical protein